MRSIDTNILVRVLTRDNPEQAAAADEFVRDGAWVSLLVLAETIWVLGSKPYRQDSRRLASSIEMLIEHRDFTLESPDAVASALALFRSGASISFSDCLILELGECRRN